MEKVNVAELIEGFRPKQHTTGTSTKNTPESKSLTIVEYQKHIRRLLAERKEAKFYREAQIPLRFRCKTFDDVYSKQKDAYRKAILAGKSLFVTGGCGTGKTFLAVALVQEYYINGLAKVENYYTGEDEFTAKKKVYFLPATELFLRLKVSFGKEEGEADILDNIGGYDLLILDDIGTDRVSDWSKQIIYTIIDRRYRNMQQTILTSNLNLQEIGKIYDDRIASRLMEMGDVIKLSGKDKRR